MIQYHITIAMLGLVWGASYVINVACLCLIPVAFKCEELFEMDDFEEDLCVVLFVVLVIASANPELSPLGALVGLFLLWRLYRTFQWEFLSSESVQQRAVRVTPDQPPELPSPPPHEEEQIITPDHEHQIWPPSEAFRR